MHNTNRTPSPRDIVADATMNFHTLIRLYYLRHGCVPMDVYIIQPLALLGSMCLNTLKGQSTPLELETARSTLFLTLEGLYKQSRSNFLSEILFRVIRGQVQPAEAALIAGFFTDIPNRRDESERVVRSRWSVSKVNKADASENHTLSHLAAQYAGFDEEDETDEPMDTLHQAGRFLTSPAATP